MSFNWTCPFCGRDQAVTAGNLWEQVSKVVIATHAKGDIGVGARAVVCASESCSEIMVEVRVVSMENLGHGYWRPSPDCQPIISNTLIPQGKAKPQPDYIPQQIRDDYMEACLIAELSPKASATLSRRCLQGMLRDFCKVKPARLVQEIDSLVAAIENKTAPHGVSIDSIEAITALRKIGNYGAHMESDVNTIVSVDKEEAAQLISLIEMLLDDWYVESHKRAQRFSSITGTAEAKHSMAKGYRLAPKPGESVSQVGGEGGTGGKQ